MRQRSVSVFLWNIELISDEQLDVSEVAEEDKILQHCEPVEVAVEIINLSENERSDEEEELYFSELSYIPIQIKNF